MRAVERVIQAIRTGRRQTSHTPTRCRQCYDVSAVFLGCNIPFFSLHFARGEAPLFLSGCRFSLFSGSKTFARKLGVVAGTKKVVVAETLNSLSPTRTAASTEYVAVCAQENALGGRQCMIALPPCKALLHNPRAGGRRVGPNYKVKPARHPPKRLFSARRTSSASFHDVRSKLAPKR